MHKDIKPSEASTLIYYIEAFSGDIDYELRDKEPTSLASAQSMAIKIERNMQASRSQTFLVLQGTVHPNSQNQRRNQKVK